MNKNGFLKPKIEIGFDLIRSVSVRLTWWIQLYYRYPRVMNSCVYSLHDKDLGNGRSPTRPISLEGVAHVSGDEVLGVAWIRAVVVLIDCDIYSGILVMRLDRSDKKGMIDDDKNSKQTTDIRRHTHKFKIHPSKKVTQHDFNQLSQFVYEFVFIMLGIIWKLGYLSFHWYFICHDCFAGTCAGRLNWVQWQKINVAKLDHNFKRWYHFVC